MGAPVAGDAERERGRRPPYTARRRRAQVALLLLGLAGRVHDVPLAHDVAPRRFGASGGDEAEGRAAARARHDTGRA